MRGRDRDYNFSIGLTLCFSSLGKKKRKITQLITRFNDIREYRRIVEINEIVDKQVPNFRSSFFTILGSRGR